MNDGRVGTEPSWRLERATFLMRMYQLNSLGLYTWYVVPMMVLCDGSTYHPARHHIFIMLGQDPHKWFNLKCEGKKAPKYKVAKWICVCLSPGEILEGADLIWSKAVHRSIASSNTWSTARNQTRTKCNACLEEIKGHTTDWAWNIEEEMQVLCSKLSLFGCYFS